MDKDFFVEELQTHHAMLYRIAYTILQNDDACRDALQEAALKAYIMPRITAVSLQREFRPPLSIIPLARQPHIHPRTG